MLRPDHLFDRVHEWDALAAFVGSPQPGATLGLVYGRRRQGKTYLLETLVQEAGGLYIAALDQAGSTNLDRVADAYRTFTGSRAPVRFADWDEALTSLLALGEGASSPVPVVIDEFPYLLRGAPELPSVLQARLSPRGAATTSWRTRLVLCGSALSTMQNLLTASAPLRGRASMELMVHPFGYREAARFWGVADDPDLAVRLDALVGGTPAYLDMSGGVGPASADDFDGWVCRALLSPASAMLREGAVVVSEEPRIADTSLYHAVLDAVSRGRTRRGEIAAHVGRPVTALGHPLTVLTEARLIEPLADALRDRRSSYRIAEPVVRFHRLVVAPHEHRLAAHQASAVWAEVADTVSARIYGPHFERIARTWSLLHAPAEVIGGPASIVAPTEVPCKEHRTTHEIDLVVIGSTANTADHILALGEAKWRTTPCTVGHLRRLEHLRQLVPGAAGCRLLLFSRRGFDDELADTARRRADVKLVSLDRLYEPDP
jgi:uncharacterized protein